MLYTSPIVLGSLILALLAAACTKPGECGESDRGCVDPTGDTTDATPTSTGPTDAPTTSTTTGTPGGLMRCTPTCTVNADCTLGGMDIGFTCVDGECGPPPCVDDLGCQQILSGWNKPCTNTAECTMGEACIDIGAGEGRCAIQPGRIFKCTDFGLVDLMMPALADGVALVVCGNIDATCKADACFDPCQSDAECPAEQGTPHCQQATGECTCAADDECQATMQPGFTACIDGRCGCSDDADCAGGTNVDVCVTGSCACSSTAACTAPVFDNVTQLCEPA